METTEDRGDSGRFKNERGAPDSSDLYQEDAVPHPICHPMLLLAEYKRD